MLFILFGFVLSCKTTTYDNLKTEDDFTNYTEENVVVNQTTNTKKFDDKGSLIEEKTTQTKIDKEGKTTTISIKKSDDKTKTETTSLKTIFLRIFLAIVGVLLLYLFIKFRLWRFAG